jgi:hypothetical protein
MRSLAIIALAGSIASTSLMAQSLTEHAAAAAGATIGTAAGKPLGTALGKIFGSMDNSTSTAAGAKATKPAETKVVKPPTPEAPATAPALSASPAVGGGGFNSGPSGGSTSARSGSTPGHRAFRSLEEAVPAAIPAPTPISEPVKEPTVEEIAAVQVGATATEVQAALGAPESRVSIPDDDGHLLEICQYWSKGQALGTVRLDNGRVVSVQTH